ncbi:MAG: outer membrane lipoprotein-sorting protein [Opitutaceae bacterium]
MKPRLHAGRAGVVLVGVLSVATGVLSVRAGEPDATELIRESFRYYRGEASEAVMEMTIHRPEWERSQTLEAWTRGDDDSVIVITDPARDRGNGTLKKGEQMWTFNPRVNRVIKLPPSLMSQSWMGSDFTNHDLAKTDSILVDYTHELTGTTTESGLTVYEVLLTPKPGAPVVWGKQVVLIREDKIMLRETFFDQDGELVKTLEMSQLEILGGRLLPRILTMVQANDATRYTRIEYRSLQFLESLPDRVFTETFLRNPRR